MMVYNNIQILTGFEDNSSLVCPKDESVVRSRRLRATDLFECQTKLLLFEKPLCNCFIIHLYFSKIFLFNIRVRQVPEYGRGLDV